MLDVLLRRVRRGGGERGRRRGRAQVTASEESGRTLQIVPSLAWGRSESPRTRPNFSAAGALGHVSLCLLAPGPMWKYRLISGGRDGSLFSHCGVSTFS